MVVTADAPWPVKSWPAASDIAPVPPLATLTGVDRLIVPLVVIVPPDSPVPAVMEVTVPSPPLSAPHAGKPLTSFRTWPSVPFVKALSVFAAEAYRRSPAATLDRPVPPLATETGVDSETVTSPLLPPPLKPVPAMTPVMSPPAFVSASSWQAQTLVVAFHLSSWLSAQLRSRLSPELSASSPEPLVSFTAMSSALTWIPVPAPTASVPLVVTGPPVKPAPESTEVTVPPVSEAPVIVPVTVRFPATAASPSTSTLKVDVPAAFCTSRTFVLAVGSADGLTKRARPERLNVSSPVTVEAASLRTNCWLSIASRVSALIA